MTDTQLLTLAITLLAIFIAMLVNNHRMTDLRTDVGLRMSDFVKVMDQRFADMDKRFDQRFTQVDQRFAQVDQRFAQVDQRFAQVDQRFLDTNRHIDDMATMLRAEMRAERAETNAKLDSILAFIANVEQRVNRLEDRIH